MDCYFISRIPLLICPISSDSVELTMKRVVIFAIFPRRLLVTVSTSCIGLCQLRSPLKVWSLWPPPSSAIKVPRYWCLTLSWYSQWNNAVGVFSYNEVLLNCWNVRKLLISFNCVGSLLELALWLSYHDQSFACPGHIFSPLCPIRLIPYQKRAFGKGYVVPISNVFRSKAIAELYIKNYLSRAHIPLGPNSLILYSQCLDL